MKGVVKFFEARKGYGFIECDDKSPDCFVHFSQILADGHKKLVEGQRVEFEVTSGPKGPAAEQVSVIE